ncbi:isopenicillin n epimerase [Plakobranchus ocellatus]|uniref:Isopenicillin n epimerase n=1 Tax=Plakobranchus ocellatus TaxID=259542 RepID=A0AAV3Y3B8_9GAST|nr:isopenicillin n epimerase [Plakobranchus ocellatus]
MASTVKRGFGSFHASNVQELLSLPKDEYIPPQLPFTLPPIGDGLVIFGSETKKAFFLLEDECCFLNHGAFGAALKPALEMARTCQLYTERQPLRFYDRELLPFLVHVYRRMATFVNCCPTDLVLVNNATFATNSVLNSFPWTAGDVILTFNITYGAVKKLVQHICSKTGAVNREAKLTFPMAGKEEVLEVLRTHLDAGDITLVIIDHIPSNAPVVLPVAEMVQLCRAKEARVLIDGAHALGSIPLDLQAIDPDYYVSNCHKWFCSPKGAAILYVTPALQHQVRPAVISHGLGSGFSSEFVWTGLHDYSPVLALHTVLDFWETMTPTAIRSYISQLLKDATDFLIKCWNTRLAAPLEMFGSMALVELPENIYSMFTTVDYSAAEMVQNYLYTAFNIEVPIKSLQGKLYVRISAHIHNELSDYEKLGAAVLTYSNRTSSQ